MAGSVVRASNTGELLRGRTKGCKEEEEEEERKKKKMQGQRMANVISHEANEARTWN